MKRATNLKVMKRQNQKLVLNLIRQGNYSRADIAAAIHLTKPAISAIVDELEEQGIVYDIPAENPGCGRPPHWLRISPNACYCIGLDITRQFVSVGLINPLVKVLCEDRFPVGEVEPTLRKAADTAMWQIKDQHIDESRVLGIGITAPGPMDQEKKTILQPTNFSAWHHAKVGEILSQMTGWQICMDNVANARALCEKYYGAAKELHHFMTLVVDEGVGSGIIIDDKVFHGVNEIGHTSICYNGPLCECGNYGCLEKYASLPEILKGTGHASWHQAVQRGDDLLIQKEAEYLASAIISAASLMRLQMVVLSGEISRDPHPLMEYIQKIITARRPKASPLPVIVTDIHSTVLCAGTILMKTFFQ